jgi:hypothetical protein
LFYPPLLVFLQTLLLVDPLFAPHFSKISNF